MSRYRKIDPRIWDDENFKVLSNDYKIAWLYVLTSQSTNQIGLFRLSLSEMGESIGVDTAKARRSVAVLEERGMVVYDSKTKLIWVPKWIYYNEPSGLNQAKGYTEVAKEYLPHIFAKAFILLNHSLASSIPGYKAFIDKKQAILIRDGCRCSYCKAAITSWAEYELDHVVPVKTQLGGKYEDLVASCKACNRRKGSFSAEEFGFPFVRGTDYSLREASIKLIFDKDLRTRFAKVCGGLPPELAEMEVIEDIIIKAVRTPLERRWNGKVTPSVLRNRNREQEQEQEQEEERTFVAEKPATLTFSPQNLAILWNEKAPPEMARVNLPFKRSPKAMEKIKDALKRNPDLEWWAGVIQRMFNSSFLRGEKGWKADLDFMVRKAEEIVDGKYDGGKPMQPKSWAAIAESAQRRKENA